VNDHPAHAGDIVRRRTDHLIVTVTFVGPDLLLHTTQWTGGPDIPMSIREVDVLTPAGVA
jgi:hypothetical protein